MEFPESFFTIFCMDCSQVVSGIESHQNHRIIQTVLVDSQIKNLTDQLHLMNDTKTKIVASITGIESQYLTYHQMVEKYAEILKNNLALENTKINTVELELNRYVHLKNLINFYSYGSNSNQSQQPTKKRKSPQ